MKNITLILIFSLSLISCSQKNIPFGLQGTINEIDKNLNDTVKYDFKLASENIATSKHHFGLGLDIRNGKNLWRSSLLKTYFKLNGIYHPDDMSGIILTTYHRELNGEPFKFREQKKYYKEYWKVAQMPGDTIEKWYNYKNPQDLYDKEREEYLSNFKQGRKVLGSINAWKKRDNGFSGSSVNFIGAIIEKQEKWLNLEILELGKPESGFELEIKVGDTLEVDPFEVFLIPEEK